MRENKLSGQINLPLKEIVEVFFIMSIVYIVLSFFGLDTTQVISAYAGYTFSIITGAMVNVGTLILNVFDTIYAYVVGLAQYFICSIPVLNLIC